MDLLCGLTLLFALHPPPCYWQAERMRFPTQEMCEASLALNDAYGAYLRAELDYERHRLGSSEERLSWLNAAYAEACNCRRPWWYLSVSNDQQREQVSKDPEKAWAGWMPTLREMIGDDAYHAGQMPPVVPAWRWVYVR